jgi:hypothetical protein
MKVHGHGGLTRVEWLDPVEGASGTHELPVVDQSVIDEASAEVSVLANSIGYALAERGAKVTTDDVFAAAQHVVDQGWRRDDEA